MIYKVEYLPIAERDIIDITVYISTKLTNTEAALIMSNKIVNAIDKLEDFPYIYPVLYTTRVLTNEYRKLVVDNYIVLYSVNELQKIVTICRVVYSKSDYIKQL